jgi:hypothetical protein
MQFGVMVPRSRSKVTSTQIFCLTHLCPLIHPHTKYQLKIFIRLGDTERKGISVSRSQSQGQSRIDTILSRDTPLSPGTSSHQISTKNLQSVRNYRAEGKYYAIWGHGHWVKVKSTQIFCLTDLCPPIHPHTKYQPKIFICLGDTEQKGILVSRSQGQCQRSHRHDSFVVTHLCSLIHHPCKFHEKILQC